MKNLDKILDQTKDIYNGYLNYIDKVDKIKSSSPEFFDNLSAIDDCILLMEEQKERIKDYFLSKIKNLEEKEEIEFIKLYQKFEKLNDYYGMVDVSKDDFYRVKEFYLILNEKHKLIKKISNNNISYHNQNNKI